MSNKVDAYLRGYEGALTGRDMEDGNPYLSDNSGSLWASWRQGFSDALQNKRPVHKKSRLTVEKLFHSTEG